MGGDAGRKRDKMINFKSVAEKMLIDFKDTANIPHQGVKGRARESIVFEQYLKPYIPPRYAISTGLIFDIENNTSRQQDLVIFDEFNTPVLKDLSTEKLFFPESILAVIEVKSTLTSEEMDDIAKKSASVWKLKQTPVGQIVLTPNLVLPSQNLLPLCLGVCFTSKINLESAAKKLSEIRSADPKSHALSAVCILEDKDGKSGLIVNVSENDITKTVLLPSSQSRIATLNCDSPGSALLYLYLLLMEHLRLCGIVNSAPDLLEYAKASKIAEPKLHIAPEEMRGALINIEGKSVNVDDLETFRKLSLRQMAEDVTDQEIIDWFHLQSVVSPDVFKITISENSRIYIDGLMLEEPTPLQIYSAITKQKRNEQSDEDIYVIRIYTELVRMIWKEKKRMLMGVFNK